MLTVATCEKLQIERPPSEKVTERRLRGQVAERQTEEAIECCECLMDIAAALFNVSSKELRRTGRTGQDVSRVRQIAMYVGHVVLGLSMSDIGKGFARDRTTVMYACHLIEDLRDAEEFDRVVAMMERIVLAAFRHRLER